jgi:DNA-binding NarL/FixJ family response regulator
MSQIVQVNVPLRVVIAEDSRLFQASLLALLAGVAGIRVVAQAYSGVQAIETIQREKPHVVLLDLGLPQGDGFRVLENSRATGDPIYVVVSFSADATVRDRCRSLGAHFFHDKASDPESLLDFFGRLVEGGPSALAEARQSRGARPEDFLIPQNT